MATPGEQPAQALGARSTAWRTYAWGAAGALALFTLGCLAHGLIWTMSPREGSSEATFARDMAAHHGQAVELALLVRDRTDDAVLRQFALDIVLTQQAQIGQMQGWLAAWGLPLAGREPPMAGHDAMMGMASQEQVNSLRTLPPDEAEIAFLQLMIRHHEGGVTMAREALAQVRRDEVVRLARAIMAGQQSEIAGMGSLLEQRGAPLHGPQPPMPMDQHGS